MNLCKSIGDCVREDYKTRDEWLEGRRRGVGGSDASSALGISPWKSAFSLYCEKSGLVDDKVDNESIEWGNKLEPLIAEKYIQETGRKCNRAPFTIYRHPQIEWLQCSIDGLIEEAAGKTGFGVLEIKTTQGKNIKHWEETPPAYYMTQLQHNMAVVGAAWGSFAVLFGGQKFRWFDVERNDEYIEKMLEEEEKFWKRVEEKNPPPPDSSEHTQKLLNLLYPQDSGVSKSLGVELVAFDERRQRAAEEIEKWADEKRLCEAQIKAALGEAAVGVLPTGVSYHWKTQDRKSYTVPASVSRVLRRSEK